MTTTKVRNSVTENEVLSPDSTGKTKVNMFTKLTRMIGITNAMQKEFLSVMFNFKRPQERL
jgi:hypothetical protein